MSDTITFYREWRITHSPDPESEDAVWQSDYLEVGEFRKVAWCQTHAEAYKDWHRNDGSRLDGCCYLYHDGFNLEPCKLIEVWQELPKDPVK